MKACQVCRGREINSDALYQPAEQAVVATLAFRRGWTCAQ